MTKYQNAINEVKAQIEKFKKGVMVVSVKGEYATFEYFEGEGFEKVTVNVRDYEKGYGLKLVKTTVSVEDYLDTDGEIDIAVNTFTYDETFNKIDFDSVTKRSYKQMKRALMFGYELSNKMKVELVTW